MEAFTRLTADERENFIDPGSEVTTYQMLALAWAAIHDEAIYNKNETEEVRKDKVKDAERAFLQGLYEIQRGYNFDEKGREMEGGTDKDKEICAAGTFNKIMEKLNGIHPDVKILFITWESLNAKLLKVIQEKAAIYLEKNPEKVAAVIKEGNFSPIADQIKAAVAGIDEEGNTIKDGITDEFQSLWHATNKTGETTIEVKKYKAQFDATMNAIGSVKVPSRLLWELLNVRLPQVILEEAAAYLNVKENSGSLELVAEALNFSPIAGDIKLAVISALEREFETLWFKKDDEGKFLTDGDGNKILMLGQKEKFDQVIDSIEWDKQKVPEGFVDDPALFGKKTPLAPPDTVTEPLTTEKTIIISVPGRVYTLYSMSELDPPKNSEPKAGKLYVSADGYCVRDPSGHVQKAFFQPEELKALDINADINADDLDEKLKDPKFKSDLLNITLKNHHTYEPISIKITDINATTGLDIMGKIKGKLFEKGILKREDAIVNVIFGGIPYKIDDPDSNSKLKGVLQSTFKTDNTCTVQAQILYPKEEKQKVIEHPTFPRTGSSSRSYTARRDC